MKLIINQISSRNPVAKALANHIGDAFLAYLVLASYRLIYHDFATVLAFWAISLVCFVYYVGDLTRDEFLNLEKALRESRWMQFGKTLHWGLWLLNIFILIIGKHRFPRFLVGYAILIVIQSVLWGFYAEARAKIPENQKEVVTITQIVTYIFFLVLFGSAYLGAMYGKIRFELLLNGIFIR